MTINFPSSLDNFTNPTSSSPINSPSHANQHANANDAIEALEAKVGVDGSTVATSHDYKIAQLQSLVTSAVAGAKSIYQDVRNQSGSAFTKATPVYVSGSTGASGQLLVSAASNATEAASSKTMGITTSAISNNSNGQVISEGILEGIDTTGAADGDPVWLGTNGAKIYGLANKPSAPAHLVFLGIVIRGGQANTGSMYVKIQNGFELHELHNVEVSSLVNGNILAYDSTTQTWKNTNTIQSTSSTVPLVIKGAVSQSANLQEWQDNSGTTQAYVSPTGKIWIKNDPSFNPKLEIGSFFVDGFGGIYSNETVMFGSLYYGDRFASGAVTIINRELPSSIVLGIKGKPSQTGDLTQWRDSAGTVKASIAANGDFTNNAIFTAYGRFGGAAFTDAAALRVNSYNPSVPTAVIKAIASQTTNIQEWQDSSSTPLASISSGGGFYTQDIQVHTNRLNSAMVSVSTGYLGNPGIIIRGVSGQTANLQEWQNSNGDILGKIDQYGNLILNTAANVINGSVAGYTPLTVKGAASQTANLQEWQNSAGAALFTVQSDGSFKWSDGYSGPGKFYWGNAEIGGFGNGIGMGQTWYFRSYNSSRNAVIIQGQPNQSATTIIIKSDSNQTSNLQEWQNSSGSIIAQVDAYGSASFGGNNTYGSSIGIGVGGNASQKGITVRGTTLQSGNLQEWQSSSGTVENAIIPGKGLLFNLGNDANGSQNLTQIAFGFSPVSSSTGNWKHWVITKHNNATSVNNAIEFYTNDGTQSGVYPTNAIFGLSVTNGGIITPKENINIASASTIGLVVRGAASQTADLQQWQNSSGTVLAKVNASGYITFSSGIKASNYGYIYTSNTQGSVGFLIADGNAGYVPLVVKGVASQAADLQQWQDSSGTVVAKVDADGFSNATGYRQIGGNSNAFGDTTTSGVVTTFGSGGNASIIPVVVKGASSQTADLQQWKNSSGTVLAKINGVGQFVSDVGFAVTAGNYGGAVGYLQASSASYVGLIIKAAASQTANLQEWRDSGSTVLANVDSIGSFTGRAFKPSGYTTTNSSGGTYTNYWCKLADFSHLYQYSDFNFYIDFYVYGPGFTYVPRGKLFVRSKQQNPLGSAPETPTIVVYDGEGNAFNASDFALVVVQNDSSATKFELYYKMPIDWASLVFTPTLATGSTGSINFYNTVLPISSLPSGTKTYGRNSDGKFNSITITPEANNVVNLIVKPVTGQTYNLTEWHSGGGIVSYVASSGAISSNTAITATSFVKSGGTASQFLKADGSSDSSTYISTTSSYVAGHHPEGRILASAALVNDLGNARLRGSTFTFTNISPSNSDIDKMFDGTANFLMISPTSSQTFPIVIEFTLPRTLSYGAVVGIGFGYSTWRTNSVKIEAFSEGAWVTCIDTTTNTSEDILVSIPGNSGTGTTKLRYTLANPNSSQLRICHLWAYNYNSDMWTQLQMPRSGGTMYGSLTTQGSNTVLGSSNTVQSLVRGTASQTTDLQQWQNSSGTVLLAINSNGNLSMTSATRAFFGGSTDNGYVNISTEGNGSRQGLIIKGSSSQTANLQEWQDSSGTAKTLVSGNGYLVSSNAYFTYIGASADTGTYLQFSNSTGATFNIRNAAHTGIMIKAAASQTADLQQWQDSSGTTLVSISANADLNINTSSTGRINLGDAQISKGPGTSFIFNSGINSGNIYAQSTYSGSVVLTVKGTSGQQQYFSIQDSSGSAGIYVDQYMQMIHATNTYFNGIINNSGNWSISNSGNLSIKQITSNISSTISVNTASTVDTVALSSFTSMEYTLSIKQGSKIRSSKVLVHTDGTSVDSTEYGIMEMGGGITGILVAASVSSTNAILQVTITDAATTNATVKLIKTML